MAEYVRPDLTIIDPAELSDYLLEQGIRSRTHIEADGLHIETDLDASAALASFVPTSTMDRAAFQSTYVPRVLATEVVAAHLQHLKDFRSTIRSGGPAPTLAQTQHVLADVIDALRLLDSRLERDT